MNSSDDPVLAEPQAAAPGELPWQRAQLSRLLALRGRWPHALLVAGPAGIGKLVLAQTLARALLCESPDDAGRACGACAGCRYVAAGAHPDLRIIQPVDVDDDGNAKAVEWIGVDRIRDLTGWVTLSSHRRGAKIALIAPAERMNTPAANALLKTLEEPPANTFLILVSHQPERLPATIASRCQRIDAARPTPAEGRAWLAGRGMGETEHLLAQAAFAPLAAEALHDAAYQAERAVWIAAFADPRALPIASLGARVDAGPRDSRRDRLAAVIDWMSGWCADLARVRSGGAPVQNVQFVAVLENLGRSVAPLELFRYHRDLLRQRALISHPLQPRLVSEALLFDYRELFE